MTIDLPICLEDVQNILEVIIETEGLKNPKLTFEDGSKMGDGFLAVNRAVTISDDTNRNLHLFIKSAPKHLKLREISETRYAYQNEFKFYKVIHPAIVEFYRNRTGEDLEFAPKFYAGSIEDMKELIVLENLKKTDFELNGVRNTFDKEQLELIMEKYGQFHGTSFAFKDQNEETFESITSDTQDVLHLMFTSMGLGDIVKYRCKFIERYLQSSEDTIVLEKIKFLGENWDKILLKIQEHKKDFATMLHGDCWSNNMMFRQNKDNQLEIRLIDFQCIRINSPVLDLCYLFYASGSSEENLSQLDYYLDVYYKNLSTTINKLGSDPEKLYPKSVLKEDWKKFASFGLIMAFMIMVYVVDEAECPPDVVEFAESQPPDFITTITDKNKQDFVDRIKIIVKHLIRNDFI